MKGPDGLCTDCGCTHDLWHAENPAEWEYREGCACYLCQEQERKMSKDTQFQGFAKLLFEELYAQFNNLHYQEEDGSYQGRDKEAEQTRKDIQETIARRAYNLVFHAVDNSRANDMEDWETERIMPYVPDMTELPKEQE